MNKPTRTPAIDHLAFNLAICLATVNDTKKDAEETNAALAFCELAVSLPPAWFTATEREIVVALIKELYGNPHDFINALSDGSVSYYNHMIAKMRDMGEKKAVDLDDAVMGLMEMHTAKFGAPVV
jgi:hypothetical protein